MSPLPGRTKWRAACMAVAVAVMALGATAAFADAGKGDRDTLRAVSLLFRHSVISPKYNPPKVEVDWPMGYKQLTAVGMRYMYEAGQALRRKYVTELALIAGRYKMPEVYVRSSNTDRALQAAQMLMLGLYPLGTGPNPSIFDKSLKAAPAPELAFTPVPIHAVGLKNDIVMRPWTARANCTKYRKYVKSLRRTPSYKKQARKFKKFLKRMSALTGVNEGKKTRKILYEINEIYEPLSANVQHNLPLPKGITSRDMELMSRLADWNYHHQFLGREIGRLTGGPFVGEVIANFSNFIESGGKARKFYLYSGHQRTMLGVEAALGIETARTEGPLFKGRVPPLGSHYAFELHEPSNNRFMVRLKFVSKKEEKIIPIPGCPGAMCPFERFKTVAGAGVPEDWGRECAS